MQEAWMQVFSVQTNNSLRPEDDSSSVGSLTEQDLLFDVDHDAGASADDNSSPQVGVQQDDSCASLDASSPTLRLVRRQPAWRGWDMHVLEGPMHGLALDGHSVPTSPEYSPRSASPETPAAQLRISHGPARMASCSNWAFSAASKLAPLSCPEQMSSEDQANPTVQTPPFARSCPRPIVRPGPQLQCKQTHNAGDQDEDGCFMPPHQMMASADPIQSADASRRHGGRLIRLRAGVLRKTGYLDGHTETLRSVPRAYKGL